MQHISRSSRRLFVVTACIGMYAASISGYAQTTRPMAPPASAEKRAKTALAIEHQTARGLYDFLKEEAGGGDRLSGQNIPDWSGVWTREANIFFWDTDQGDVTNLPPAKLTPEYSRRLIEKLDAIDQGIEYDPLSAGNPAGMPRWMAEPFLKDFAVTPTQTWLINEMMNEVRRVYTDGRDHPAPEDAYPLWLGDSIGFWDDGRLIIHTNQLRAGQYQRIQPHYSEQVESVEIWEKTADDTITVEMWTFDPPALVEPWYVRHVFKKLTNDDNYLRIRYWHFNENQNNAVEQTDTGASDFTDFTFD